MDDVNLVTHLLCMCLAKWQTQYDLMENAMPVSTGALLLVLENIENNAELNAKPSSVNKANGPKESTRWSQWTPTFLRSPRKWAGLRNTACYAKSMEGCTRVTTHVTAVVLMTVLQSKGMGVQVSPTPKKGNRRVQTLPR